MVSLACLGPLTITTSSNTTTTTTSSTTTTLRAHSRRRLLRLPADYHTLLLLLRRRRRRTSPFEPSAWMDRPLLSSATAQGLQAGSAPGAMLPPQQHPDGVGTEAWTQQHPDVHRETGLSWPPL